MRLFPSTPDRRRITLEQQFRGVLMRSIDAMRDWWGGSTDPMQIVVLSGEGVLTVSITVPWFLKPKIIDVLDERLQELFHVIDQMDGRSISDVPIVQSRMPVDLDEDLVSWTREYSDPEYATQFTEALEAFAALGLAPSIH
jgi:hypothetical protein